MKQYIVIGCGRFGSSLATTMNLLGHQVMAIDKSEEIIQNLKKLYLYYIKSTCASI